MGDPINEDSKTLYLKKAITVNGKEYDHVDLREPTLGEIIKASDKAGDNGLKMMLHLIASVAETDVAVIERLPARLFKEATEYLQAFIGAE